MGQTGEPQEVDANQKIIELPSGKHVAIREYAEAWVLMDLAKQDDNQKFLIESLVLSVDGNTKVYEAVRKLTIPDFKALDVELANLIQLPNQKAGT